MSLVGLDIGTTGCKCTVFDLVGKKLSSAYCEYFVEKKGLGKFELNPEKVWNSVKQVIYDAMKNNGGEKPTALAVSSFGEAFTSIDHNGRMLGNSMLYTDNRGLSEAACLEEKLGAGRIMDLTGVPVHSMYSINKVMWIKENQPDIYNRTWKFMLYEDLIIYMLTGIPVIDYSLASRTMAFNVVKKEWEPTVFDTAGVDIEMFSKAVPSGTVIGNVKKALAEELGLPPQLVVVTGGHDQACAALGAGVLNNRQAVEGIGTADCITTVFNEPVLNKIMLANNFNCEPHILPDKYISLSFTLSGGSLLKWYRDCFASSEKLEAEKKRTSVYSILDETASGEPTGILVLPHFSGSGTPYMDPYSKGAVVGLTLETTPAQIYRAILEGVTYEMRYNLECMDSAGIQVDSLRAVGGGAKSNLWLQIKADITGKKIERLNVDEAGTLAGAMIAGVATGAYGSYEEAAEGLVKSRKVYYPDPGNHDIYDQYYSRYKNIYQAIKSI